MRSDGTDPLTKEEAEAAANPNRFIEAIKLYRDRTQCGLRQAKEAVERVRFARGVESRSCCPTCNGKGYV